MGRWKSQGSLKSFLWCASYATLGQFALFLHPESPQVRSWVAAVADDLQQSSNKQPAPFVYWYGRRRYSFWNYLFGCVGVLAAACGVFAESCELPVPRMGLFRCGAMAPELKGSVVVVSRFSYPGYVGFQFPDQGTNLSPMYCKVDFNHWLSGKDILEPHFPYFIQGLNLALAEVAPDGAPTPPYSSVVPLWIGTPVSGSTHRSNRTEAIGTWPGLEGTGIGTCSQGKGVQNMGATSAVIVSPEY